MTALVAPTVADGELLLPEPVGKQVEWMAAAAKFKVLRVGRRGAKTRFAFLAAITGHGPGWDEDRPKFGGILQGGDVVWIAQTYANLSTVLWREEIIPRMGHLPWVDLNTTRHDVTFTGLGSLLLRSGDREAIASVRGVGKRLAGVIIDEAAWLDLRGALLDVIMPALIDNEAWLVIMSTTNASSDGGYDDQGAPQIPSYFNVICEEIRAGKRSADWQEFTGTAYDNPTINPKAIDDLIAEYTPGSPKLEQEVFAKLLKSGVGLALPLLSKVRHVVDRFSVPPHWTQFGGFDWGFNHPWVFGWYAADEDGNVLKVDTVHGREDEPDEIAAMIVASGAPIKRATFIVHAGHDIFTHKGRAIGFKGPTIAEKMSAHSIKVIHADIGRVGGLNNLRSYTHYDEDWPADRHPRFTLMDTPGNLACLAGMQRMQVDPKNLEDALGVDADMAGRGGDDDYDETRYALMSRPMLSRPVPKPEEEQGKSLGYDYEKHRPRVRLTGNEELERMFNRPTRGPLVGRNRMPGQR